MTDRHDHRRVEEGSYYDDSKKCYHPRGIYYNVPLYSLATKLTLISHDNYSGTSSGPRPDQRDGVTLPHISRYTARHQSTKIIALDINFYCHLLSTAGTVAEVAFDIY